MELSIIIPAYNEDRNILPTYQKVKDALKDLDYEIIFVNDGSTDDTKLEIDKITSKKVKGINLHQRMGKCYALFQGIKSARSDIIVTLDADLQNDPKDILKLLSQLNEGYDLVCGWRDKRKDGLVKKASSIIGNFVNNSAFNIALKDNNCPVKVFKKEGLVSIRYFKDFHRFIPVLFKQQGYKIAEIEVNHNPRTYGKSKYGIHNRILGNMKAIYMVKRKLYRKVNK